MACAVAVATSDRRQHTSDPANPTHGDIPEQPPRRRQHEASRGPAPIASGFVGRRLGERRVANQVDGQEHERSGTGSMEPTEHLGSFLCTESVRRAETFVESADATHRSRVPERRGLDEGEERVVTMHDHTAVAVTAHRSVVVHHPTTHHGRARPPELVDQIHDVGKQDGVVVEEHHDGACRKPETDVARMCDADPVGEQPAVGEAVRNPVRRSRALLDHDQFDVEPGLTAHRPDRRDRGMTLLLTADRRDDDGQVR